MIMPVDVGIWKFWAQTSCDENRAVYYCESCGKFLLQNPKNLPKECQYCGHKEGGENE